MPIEIKMPEFSASMTEADVIAWLVKPGERVERGDVIAELETDKSTVELEAEASGVLVEITTPAGTSAVAVGTVLALLEPETGSVAAPSPQTGSVQSSPARARPSEEGPSEPKGSTPATALARRLAEQAGLELESVRGTGASGRVVKADVEKALRGAAAQALAPQPPTTPSPTTPSSSSSPSDASRGAQPLEAPFAEIPHTRMRRTIAARLGEAKREVPHFYLRVDCEVDALLAMRRDLNEKTPECRLSVNDFVLRAVALSLVEVPEANVAWSETGLRRFERVDLAVAVATDGGLITPIVRGAEHKALLELSQEVRSLAERARSGRLHPEEYRGGTFCVSNLGMYGVESVAPILNPPQSGILGVGAALPRPVVRNGQLVAGVVMSCTLSADHRALDGAVGATLLRALKHRIEQPLEMLL